MAPHIDNLESGVLNPDPSPVVARCSHAYIPCNTARIETPIQPLPHSTRDASAVVAAERCCHANAAAPAAAMPGARMMMHAYMSIQLCMHHHTCARHRCGRGGSVGSGRNQSPHECTRPRPAAAFGLGRASEGGVALAGQAVGVRNGGSGRTGASRRAEGRAARGWRGREGAAPRSGGGGRLEESRGSERQEEGCGLTSALGRGICGGELRGGLCVSIYTWTRAAWYNA